jgi:3'-phosphoadenosine 5'-phosphosulfate sulfotransferase
VVFERPDATPAQAEPVKIVVRHLPFRRFGGSRISSAVIRGTQLIPNLKTIVAMIRFSVMPSPQLEQERDHIIGLLNEFKDDHIFLLMSGFGMKMKAIYRMENCDDAAVLRIWGNGPEKVPETDVDVFLKYISASKTLEPIPTKHFTQTTDCFCLKRALEPRKW